MRVYNFSPGPATLPLSVLEQASQDLSDWKFLGQSLGLGPGEISHRSEEFLELSKQLKHKLKKLMGIPDNYHILLMQGGAIGHMAATLFNLLGKHSCVSFMHSGHWSKMAIQEAFKLTQTQPLKGFEQSQELSGEVYQSSGFLNAQVEVVGTTYDYNFKALPSFEDCKVNKDSAYLYYCSNETVNGLSYLQDPPSSVSIPVVCDATSCILTQPIQVDRYGVIVASAQKTLGIAGVTLVLVRDDLLDRTHPSTPTVMNYALASQNNSMANTPATLSWYLMDKVVDWHLEQGGLEVMKQRNLDKSNLIYSLIDESSFYHNDIQPAYRSKVNICFRLQDESLTQDFVTQAKQKGLVALKGHKAVGGIRASMYNAFPFEGALALAEFMRDFEKKAA